MSFRGNINGQLRGFYYASSGNDDFNGQTVEVPKKTIQAAIDEATNLSPPPSNTNIALVSGSQGGSFSETMALTNFVQFNGEDTTLTSSAANTVTLASGLRCRLENATNSSSGNVFLVSGLSNVGIFAGRCGVAAGVGVNIIGTVTNIFVDFSSLDVTGVAGTGISITSTNTLPLDINIDIAMLTANDATFIDYKPATAGSECVLSISSVDSGTSTGTSAFVVRNGILAVESAGDIRADQVIFVQSGGVLRINGTHLAGDITVETGGLLQINAVLIDGDITVQDGATMTAVLGSHNGDIDNAGTLNITTLNHFGTINNTGTINGIENGERFGNWLVDIEDTVTPETYTEQVPQPDGLGGMELVIKFGGEYQFEADEDESTTTSTTLQNKLTLTTPSLPAGDYRITAHAEITNDSGDKPVVVEIILDASENNDFFYAPKFADEYFAFQSFALLALTAGVHVVEMDFRATSEGGTAKIRRARLELFRVA